MTWRPRFLAVATALAAGLLLAGCGTEGAPTGDPEPQSSTEAQAGDETQAAEALVVQRYELVRDGDFDGVCKLYSAAFTELFAELAAVPGGTCVEAHEAATANVEKYLDTAAGQERAGLTPFFYVPSDIDIDPTAIKVDEPGLAFLGEGTVVSLDPHEFEDGVGKTPGWLAAQNYVKLGDDGAWRFIAATEQ